MCARCPGVAQFSGHRHSALGERKSARRKELSLARTVGLQQLERGVGTGVAINTAADVGESEWRAVMPAWFQRQVWAAIEALQHARGVGRRGAQDDRDKITPEGKRDDRCNLGAVRIASQSDEAIPIEEDVRIGPRIAAAAAGKNPGRFLAP